MNLYNEIIAKLFSSVHSIDEKDVYSLIEFPPKEDQGDRAIACFRWAKEKKKSPQDLAKDFASQLQKLPLPKEITKIEAQGGYVNFFFNDELLAQKVLTSVFQNPDTFEKVSMSSPLRVVIEFSSPNIAKPFSIGHLRSTNLGACLSRIYAFMGYEVTRINHLGDWGTQFGKLITAYRRWGNAQMLDENPILSLFTLYVRFHDEEKNDPTLTTEAREAFSQLEKGDESAKELWDWFRNLTMKELDSIYTRLGVEFDHLWGESFYIDQLPSLLTTLEKKGISEISEGATIVNLKKENMSVAVLQKGDESSLYITRDLAAAIYRYKEFDFYKMLYVVGSEQSLHFQQLFKILSMAGYSFYDRCNHVAFGQITFGSEKMSTRKGNVVFLQDVLARAEEKALSIIKEKNPTLENAVDISKDVALGAILFADISAKRIKNVKFAWDDILSFEGETGPYLQYSYVRTKSLLKKHDQPISLPNDFSIYKEREEKKLIRTLSQFIFSLEKVVAENEPFYLGQYLISVTKDFNRFYQSVRILDAPENTLCARMLLVFATSCVLQTGLQLLGIPAPEKM